MPDISIVNLLQVLIELGILKKWNKINEKQYIITFN